MYKQGKYFQQRERGGNWPKLEMNKKEFKNRNRYLKVCLKPYFLTKIPKIKTVTPNIAPIVIPTMSTITLA